MSKQSSSACCVYDFTLFDDTDPISVRRTLRDCCKKYSFQLERGDNSGTIHYQGRLSLKMKKRPGELNKLLRGNGWERFHLSITSKENRDNCFYVCKEDTRIEGPFTDINDVEVPIDVKKMVTLRPWQDDLKKILLEYEERVVDIIYDEGGNVGKTRFCRYMMVNHKAKKLPYCNEFKDIMRMAYDVGAQDIYFIDLPRASSKKSLYGMFSAIEELKSGYAYDDRNHFRDRIFDPPRVCIFTNEIPDLSLLSKDMWKIRTINENLELVDYEIDETADFDDIDEGINITSDKKKKTTKRTHR